jgi:putative component of toxin-antitoxin plasmid stabilization module
MDSKLVCYRTNFLGAENLNPRPLVMTYKKSTCMRKLLTEASKSLRNNEIKRSLKKIEQGNLNFGKGAKNVGDNVIESRTHKGLRILTKVYSNGDRQILAIFSKDDVTKSMQNDIIKKAKKIFVD